MHRQQTSGLKDRLHRHLLGVGNVSQDRLDRHDLLEPLIPIVGRMGVLEGSQLIEVGGDEFLMGTIVGERGVLLHLQPRRLGLVHLGEMLDAWGWRCDPWSMG